MKTMRRPPVMRPSARVVEPGPKPPEENTLPGSSRASTFQQRVFELQIAAGLGLVIYFFVQWVSHADWAFIATRTTGHPAFGGTLTETLRLGYVPALIVPLVCALVHFLMPSSWYRTSWALCSAAWAAGIVITFVSLDRFNANLQWVFSVWTPSSNSPLSDYMTVTRGAYIAFGLMGAGFLGAIALLLSRRKAELF